MVEYESRPLDAVFAALGDHTRRAILAQLQHGRSNVSTLAAPHDMSLAAISKHLRVLENAGLVVKEKQGRVTWCRLGAAPLREAAGWIATYRRFWENQFDQLERYLEETDTDQGVE